MECPLGAMVAIVTLALVSLMACGERATPSTTAQLASEAADAGSEDAGDSPNCIWDDNFQHEALDAGLEMVGGPAHIKLGDNFQAVNPCNGCGCTARGLECTHNQCPQTNDDGFRCAQDTYRCPDGPLLRRFGPNCLFPSCDAAKGHSCLGWSLQCPNGPAKSGPFCTMTCP